MKQRSSGQARSPLPPRSRPMSRSPLPSPLPVPGTVRLHASAPVQAAARDTGFSRAVKLAVRRRAGGGDAGLALCECCGTWLGQYGGDVQHIICRGMGGTSRPGIGTIVNASLMCRRDHDTAEARDPELFERGFWRHSWETPGATPLMLHGRDGGFTRWLTADGGYSATAPGVA